MLRQMQCFHVLIHGMLDWEPGRDAAAEGAKRPAGFYCHRYVLAAAELEAAEKAFRRVRANLDAQTAWISRGLAALRLDAEEVSAVPMRKLLKPDNLGYTFYDDG